MALAPNPGLSVAAVLTAGGGLLVWGCQRHGMLGLGHGGEVWEETLLHPTLLGGVGAPVTGDEGGDAAHAFDHDPLVMVSAGVFHMAAVTDGGDVWVWGADTGALLGPIPREDGQAHFRNVPVRWDLSGFGGSPVVMVACGRWCTLALTRAGHVWRCGVVWQEAGAPVHTGAPAQVAGVQGIAMVAAGQRACLAVTADGRLWSWGSQLRCPDDNDDDFQSATPEVENTPRVLEPAAFGGSAVRFVTMGLTHGALVTAAGALWVWGDGSNGCTGLGHNPETRELFRRPRRVGAPGAPQFAGARVLMAACGRAHTVVLTDGGAVWTCGVGTYGVLGHGTLDWCWEPTRIPQDSFGGRPVACVGAGWEVSMAVTAEGVLYSWGDGALGHGASETLLVPTLVAATLPPDARVARTCAAPRAHILAFCMGAVTRLGADGCAFATAPDDALSRIGAAAQGLSGAYLRMGEGLLRLVGVRRRVAA